MKIKHPVTFTVGLVIVAFALYVLYPVITAEATNSISSGLAHLVMLVTALVFGAFGVLCIGSSFTDEGLR